MPAYSPPRRFAGYEVHELLGKGGMASVFRGEHVLLQRAVAIKFLHQRLAASEAGQRRFLREARLVAKLSHPNIVTVFDFGQLDDGTYYQASELVAGTTLREYLKAGPLAPSRALGFARQLAEGLGSAHAVGVIHRDLKPSNVMVVPDPALADGFRLKLLDFGIAKPLEVTSQITQTGVAIGTPGYMSPEQCRGLGAIGPASDIYSLGVVLYAMLCGAPPFIAEDLGDLLDFHLHAAPPPPSRRAGCASAIDELVLRCLAKSPADRPSSMAEVIAEIDRIAADPPTLVEREPAPIAPPPHAHVGSRRETLLPDDDGPRTLALPADPISGGDPSTTTVPRAAPRARRRIPRVAIPVIAVAVVAVVALGLHGRGASERGIPGSVPEGTAAIFARTAASGAPAAPAGAVPAGSAPAGAVPAAPAGSVAVAPAVGAAPGSVPAAMAAVPAGAAAPGSDHAAGTETSAAPPDHGPAGPAGPVETTRAPEPTAARGDGAPRERPSGKAHKPLRVRARPTAPPATSMPAARPPPTAPPPPEDRSFERPVF